MDRGLSQLYTLYEEDDEPQAMLCGSKEQWERPTGIAVDADGSLLVADSPTSRLLTISPTWQPGPRIRCGAWRQETCAARSLGKRVFRDKIKIATKARKLHYFGKFM